MVYEKVKDIIFDVTGIPVEEILPESELVDELDVDSLDMAQILLSLENAFQIRIADEEAAEMITVEHLVKYIEERSS